MEDSKKGRFKSLIPTVKHLQHRRLLDFTPFFLFPVLSGLGYLNTDGFEMVRFILSVLNTSLTNSGPRADGVGLGIIKARFQTQIKNALCFGLARGNALAMHSAGKVESNRPA